MNHETRVTSPTGGQKGKKPSRLGALDPQALLTLGEVAGFGADKYEAHNFLKGYDWSLTFDAAQRHLLAFWGGEDNDAESGLPHVAHAAWHCLTMLAFLQRQIGTDDRPPAYEPLFAEQLARHQASAQTHRDGTVTQNAWSGTAPSTPFFNVEPPVPAHAIDSDGDVWVEVKPNGFQCIDAGDDLDPLGATARLETVIDRWGLQEHEPAAQVVATPSSQAEVNDLFPRTQTEEITAELEVDPCGGWHEHPKHVWYSFRASGNRACPGVA